MTHEELVSMFVSQWIVNVHVEIAYGWCSLEEWRVAWSEAMVVHYRNKLDKQP
jgi:hypothetical protein